MERFKIINAFQIKLLLAIHNLVAPETAAVLTLISRCVAPMFAYLAVEGIRHTRDLKKYCLRLSVWAVWSCLLCTSYIFFGIRRSCGCQVMF